jgi:capsid assembly protease
MSYLDTTKRDEKSDVKVVDIVSSASPKKRLDPNTDAGRAEVQAIVDALAEVFISSVAKYRGTTVEKVTNDFGRGGMLVGAAAKKAGMANRVGSLDSVIAELAGRLRVTSNGARR